MGEKQVERDEGTEHRACMTMKTMHRSLMRQSIEPKAANAAIGVSRSRMMSQTLMPSTAT